jgi:zinc-ribbon domain
LTCPNCGAEVPPDADFCPKCGRDLRPRGSFPWVPVVLAFVAGALLCVVIGLVAGVGKTDTVTTHNGAKKPQSTTTVSSTKRVTVHGPAKTTTKTVKEQPTTATVTSTATVSTTATSTTTVSTTKTVTGGG